MAQMDKSFIDVLDGMHAPKMKMDERPDLYVLTVVLDADQFADPEVSIEGPTLTISSVQYEVSKFSESTSSRQIRLAAIPLGVDTTRAESEFHPETNTLTVTLPKLPKDQTKKTRVRVKARA